MESILDAAEGLVAEVGYDEMTTNAVASRAGISPGSLYQYFGNKGEILDGLLARYAAHMDAFWDAQLGPASDDLAVDAVVDQVIDGLVEVKAERPAFWALFHGSATSGALADAACRLDDQLAARMDRMVAVRAPHMAAARRRLVAEVAVATVKALLPLVVERRRVSGAGGAGGPGAGDSGAGGSGADGSGGPGSAAEAVVELKRVLTGYLEPALAPPVT
jgi:AcrR family transcriptional regulator